VVNAPNPSGGTDDRLEVLMIRNAEGGPAAVGIRVSCHPVATGAQHLITADYVGAWRASIRKAFGLGVTPFFLQGAGADARPRHAADGDDWCYLAHSELPAVGDELLAETLAVLTTAQPMRLDPLDLQGTIHTVAAPCEKRYTTREAIEAIRGERGLLGSFAERAIKLLDAGEALPDHVDFDVQTLWLNKDLALIGLNVEPLYALGAKVEKAAAPREAILLGYNNGCLGYTPDREEMKRGGYETSSYLYSVWTGPLAPGLEDVFAAGVAEYRET
jgi:neutral ceramidase